MHGLISLHHNEWGTIIFRASMLNYLLVVRYRLIRPIVMDKICTCIMMFGLVVGAFNLSSTGRIPTETNFSVLDLLRLIL